MLSSLSMFRKGWVWYGVLKWILERLKSWKEEEGLNQTMLWCCIISNKFTWTFKRFLFLSKLNNYKKYMVFHITSGVFLGAVFSGKSWHWGFKVGFRGNRYRLDEFRDFWLSFWRKSHENPNISRPHFFKFEVKLHENPGIQSVIMLMVFGDLQTEKMQYKNSRIQLK